jgi:hypothetical protein
MAVAIASQNDVQGNSNNQDWSIAGAPTLAKRSFNVHDNFAWTLTDKNSILRSYVPKVTLTEWKLVHSGELNAIRSTLNALTESTAARTVAGAVIGAGIYKGIDSLPFSQQALALETRVGYGVFKTAQVIASGVGGYYGQEALVNGIAAWTGSSYLTPYKSLYPATPTGNVYELPYLNVENFTGSAGVWGKVDLNRLQTGFSQLANASANLVPDLLFGSAGAESNFASYVKAGGEILKGLQNAAQLEFALTQPGASVETIKKFTPKDEGDTISVVFYLYNTGTIQDINDNWDFLYYLTYQNLPNRKSLNRLDPPCVYEVDVPGYKRFPIAVIESVNVVNEGTTRMIDLDTGAMASATSGGRVKVIPEAFKVSITFKSLLTSTQNLFAYSNDPSETNKIVVTEQNISKAPAPENPQLAINNPTRRLSEK